MAKEKSQTVTLDTKMRRHVDPSNVIGGSGFRIFDRTVKAIGWFIGIVGDVLTNRFHRNNDESVVVIFEKDVIQAFNLAAPEVPQ